MSNYSSKQNKHSTRSFQFDHAATLDVLISAFLSSSVTLESIWRINVSSIYACYYRARVFWAQALP